MPVPRDFVLVILMQLLALLALVAGYGSARPLYQHSSRRKNFGCYLAYSFIADFIPGEQFAAILFSEKLKQRGVTWQIH